MIAAASPLDAALDALHGLWPDPALRAWRARPHAAAIVGRPGAGKTTLLRGLTDHRGAIGLGGVTDVVTPVAGTGVRWLDTPGLDEPAKARRTLEAVLSQADVVVWVVDALRPATRLERDRIEPLARELDVRVVGARADLLAPGDQARVGDRLAGIAAPLGMAWLGLHDLRELPEALSARIQQPPPLPGPAATQALLDALSGARQAAARARQGADERLDAPGQIWQAGLAHLAALVRADGLAHALSVAVRTAAARLVRDTVSAADPSLVLSDPTLPDPAAPLARLVGGHAAWRREALGTLATWHMDGAAAIAAWRDAHSAAMHTPGARLEDALATVEGVLTTARASDPLGFEARPRPSA